MDDVTMIALQLAKVWHVTPDQVLRTSTDLVLGGLALEKFTMQYQEKYVEMVKEEGQRR